VLKANPADASEGPRSGLHCEDAGAPVGAVGVRGRVAGILHRGPDDTAARAASGGIGTGVRRRRGAEPVADVAVVLAAQIDVGPDPVLDGAKRQRPPATLEAMAMPGLIVGLEKL
jgi:hypothetical protein